MRGGLSSSPAPTLAPHGHCPRTMSVCSASGCIVLASGGWEGHCVSVCAHACVWRVHTLGVGLGVEHVLGSGILTVCAHRCVNTNDQECACMWVCTLSRSARMCMCTWQLC